MGSDPKFDADLTARASRARFHYIKSSLFRAIHVDGAIGGITPTGNIHCAIYSERAAIPQATEHLVGEDGALLPPDVIDGKAGFVREMDADLILSRKAAEELRDWLSQKITDFDAAFKPGK